MEVFYKLMVVIVASLGFWIGMRRGMMKQLMSLLGVAFGVVACRVVGHRAANWLYVEVPRWHDSFASEIIYTVVADACIFFAVYACFSVLDLVLRPLMGRMELGGLGLVLGSLYRMFRNLLFISIIYNLIAVFNPDSVLVKAQQDADANLIEATMPLAPALLDNGYDNYEHLYKLEEAKSIS